MTDDETEVRSTLTTARNEEYQNYDQTDSRASEKDCRNDEHTNSGKRAGSTRKLADTRSTTTTFGRAWRMRRA